MNDIVYVKSLVDKARKALAYFESFDQKTVDAMIRDIAKFVFDNAAELAEMADKETGMGSTEYKTKKTWGKPVSYGQAWGEENLWALSQTMKKPE
ncbi:MAG: hypothetical protein KAQ69_01370 [Spirochaetales bacterium]|nr:hypothetical protein [Spirochaetales bacterium]